MDCTGVGSEGMSVYKPWLTTGPSRNIAHPHYLRQYVESKRRWFPSVLASRLAVSEKAAISLLTSLGYEEGTDDSMELRIGREAMHARDTWIHGESFYHYSEVYDDITDYLGE